MDELEIDLRRRDWRFLLRLALLLGVVATAGVLMVLMLGDSPLGDTVARGFGLLTGPSR